MKISDILYKVCGGNMIAWNDKPGRTKEEVLAKFDEAIALAERCDAVL